MPRRAVAQSPSVLTADEIGAAEPLGAFAAELAAWVSGDPGPIRFVVLGSERRAEALMQVLQAMIPDGRVAFLPAWDCMPYDRAPPSRAAMGRRSGALRWLTSPTVPPQIVCTTPAAVIQRVPPRRVWDAAHAELRVGEAFDPVAVEAGLRRAGYVSDERVDEPGEMAVRGKVLDLFPAAAAWPCRVEYEDGRIAAIRSYDPVSQRSLAETPLLLIDPASELILDDEATPRPSEHRMAEVYGSLETLVDYAPGATWIFGADAAARGADFLDQIDDAFESRSALVGSGKPPAPDHLYWDRRAWEALLAGGRTLAADDAERRVPVFARQPQPARAFDAFVHEKIAAGWRVVLAAPVRREVQALIRRAERAQDRRVQNASDWHAVAAAGSGALLACDLPLEAGFVLPDERIAVVTARDVLGRRARGAVGGASDLAIAETDLRLGDAVVHLDHGMGRLEGLETIAAGSATEAIRLLYAGGTHLMVPVAEIAKVWRYGSAPDVLKLDRLDGDSWSKRRAEVEAAIDETAGRMVELAIAREQTQAPTVVPPDNELARFATRFGFAMTPDQEAATDAVLADLAGAIPMNRLVCGDVGFGKTEVALRAAAAAVLAGKQVAIVAPTTVLVRQHVQTFRRRFAPFGIEVAHLSRLVTPAEARAVKAGLASGAVRLVIGTHALAAKGVSFADLGLVVIDEEQRFGQRDKDRLRGLGQGVHVLTMTATPIPRTLQTALVGLQDLSVIATPPVVRQPVRTVLMPFDGPSVHDALVREKRRGGQSFVVCPRVEDIDAMAARLHALCPDLAIVVAHGKMPADAMDDTMVRFADGEGDVLLATNIIESGLDVPNANTMLVWRPDRFGLAQLHQLRGRVGRGRRRGVAYLLTEAETLPPATEKRLRTLESLDRLGAGFAISARDLDLRGAGDLIGEQQAGHLKLIGVGLYQHLLKAALARARGEPPVAPKTEIAIESSGSLPRDYIPEDDVRLAVYARLDALESVDDIAAFADEVADRFGPPPDVFSILVDRAALALRGRDLGLSRLDAGPQAIAATLRADSQDLWRRRVDASSGALVWKGERLIWTHPSSDTAALLANAALFLDQLAALATRPADKP